MKDIERYIKIKSEYDKKNGITMKVLGNKYGISSERIRQIISFDLRKYILRELIKVLSTKVLRIKKIQEKKEVLKKQEIVKKEVLFEMKKILDTLPNNRRKETIEVKRQIAYDLYLSGFSYSEIGRFFGHKDHTTARK